jgi:hypothetical protein
MIVSSFVVAPLLTINSLSPKSQSGLDVLSDCTESPKILMSMILQETRAKVSLSIENWREINESCNTLRIHVPGTISLPLYASKIQEPPSNQPTATPDPKQLPEAYALPVGFGKELTYLPNYHGFGVDVLEFHPKNLDGFVGNVEFTWLNILEPLNYYSEGLYIPIRSIQIAGDTLRPTQSFKFSIISPKDYLFEKSIPEASAYQNIAKKEFLAFEINTTTDLAIWYTNSTRQKYQNFILLIFTAIFGIGITLLFEDLISRLRKNKDG